MTTSGDAIRSPPDRERPHARKSKPRRSAKWADVCLAQLEAVIESVDEAVIVCDAGGRAVRMNRRAMEMCECASVEQAWQSVSDFADRFEVYTPDGSAIPPADWPLSRLVRGETIDALRVRIHDTHTGAEWVARCCGTPVRDPRGEMMFAVLTLRRLDEPMEDALYEKESRLTSIFRAAPVGIGLVSDRILLDVNDRFCEMAGYRREELIGRNWRILYPTQEEWEHVGRERCRQTRERGTGAVETRWRRNDGEIVDVLLSFTPLDPEDLSKGVTFTALDITDRKKAEDELRSIFDLSLDMICIADIRTNKFTKVNPAFERTLGYSEQELLSRPFADFIHPDDVDDTMAAIRDKLGRGERVFNFENRFRGKDGSYHWLNWTAQPRVEQGLTYAVARDVTEHKRVENALKESLEHERSLGDLIRYASVAICVCSPDGRLRSCNPAFYELTGYAQEELTTITWHRDLTPPQWREQEAAKLEELVRTGKAVRYEKECIRKDGSIVPIELVVHPEFDSEGTLQYCFAFITDITDRKRAENALQFTQFAVDHTADAAFWMTDDARFFYVNEAACRALGYSRDELMAMTVYDIDPLFTESMWAESWREIRVRKSAIIETAHKAKDGRIFPVEIRANYVKFGGHEYNCAFARDITERKRAEEALRESEGRHRRLVENLKRSHFVYMHDTEGLFKYVSESITDILGYTAGEFLAHYSTYLTDHPVNQAVRRHTELTVQGIRQPPYEVNIWHKDGSTRWLEVQEVPVLDDQGKVVVIEGVAQDITERRQAEEALRESEERHRFLIESVNDWIWEVDQNGVYTYASPQCREMLGYEPQEIVGKTPFDLMPPEEGRRMREIFGSIAGQAKPFRRLENVNRRKDGSLVVLETNGVPVLDAQGKLAGYRGIDRDITERRQAEEALREKEYLLSESQRIGHIGTWSADLVTNTATWTRETYRLLGVSPETFVPSAEALLGLLHPDDREAMQEWMRAALAGEHPDVLEFRVVLPDGSIRVVSGRGELILGDDNKPLRLVGTAQDVTEQKQAEASLRELSQENEEALRVARMAHWEFDVATGVFTFNDQYYTLYGTTAREAGGYQMTAKEFARRYVHPDDAHLVQENIHKAIVTDDPSYQFQTEARTVRVDGGVRWMNVWFRVEKDAQGRTIKLHGVNQDITERRYAEEELHRLNEHLELLVARRTEDLTHTVARLQQMTWELSQAEDRERKRIADILHDDVQQTLAAARFHLNLLSIETRSAEDTQEIIRQVRQMLREAIEKARNLSHELSPALYQVGLEEILNWLACHMQHTHGLTVHVEVHGRVDSSSEPVKALLYKVAQELLFNIIKHAGVQEAWIRLQRAGRYICLTVIDHGLGFDPQEIEGTAGFGLLSIRERIGLLGGRMKIRSTRGRGSRLLVAIPDEGPCPPAGQSK